MKPAAAPPTLAAEQAAFHTIFPGVMVAMFLAAIDQTILAAAIPAIVAALGGFADVSWLASAYLLAATVTAPFYGHPGIASGGAGCYGRTRLFTAASVACALAQSLSRLIAARALQGLSGSGLMTLAQALISEHMPPRERGRFQGYSPRCSRHRARWPAARRLSRRTLELAPMCAMNLPLGAIAAVLALRIPRPVQARSARSVADVPGAMLFSVSAVALLYALSSAGHRFDWTSATLLALLGLAATAPSRSVGGAARARSGDPDAAACAASGPALQRARARLRRHALRLRPSLPFYLQLSRGMGIGESGCCCSRSRFRSRSRRPLPGG